MADKLLAEKTHFTRDVLGRYVCNTWEEAFGEHQHRRQAGRGSAGRPPLRLHRHWRRLLRLGAGAEPVLSHQRAEDPRPGGRSAGAARARPEPADARARPSGRHAYRRPAGDCRTANRARRSGACPGVSDAGFPGLPTASAGAPFSSAAGRRGCSTRRPRLARRPSSADLHRTSISTRPPSRSAPEIDQRFHLRSAAPSVTRAALRRHHAGQVPARSRSPELPLHLTTIPPAKHETCSSSRRRSPCRRRPAPGFFPFNKFSCRAAADESGAPLLQRAVAAATT